MTFRALLLSTLVWMAVVVWLAVASAQVPSQLDVTQVISEDYPEVTAVVTVRDAEGSPIGGLPADALHVLEDGREAEIVEAQPVVDAETGMCVVLVIDTSGSMAGPPLDSAREAAIRFVDSLLASDQATIIPFADAVGPASPLSGDKQVLAQAIQGLQAVGSTALYDAVVIGVRTAREAPLPRKVVILLTDGEDYGSRSTFSQEESLAEAAATGVPVFAVALGEAVNTAYLQELATRTRGQFLLAPAPADIPAVYDDIGRLLRAQYLLRMRLPGEADGGTSELRVTATIGAATVSGVTSFPRPAPALPPATPAPTATAPAALPEPAAAEKGEPVVIVWAMAGAAAAAIVAGGAIVVRRRLRARAVRATVEGGPAHPDEPYRPPPPLPTGERALAPSARLVVIEGPDAGRSVRVGEEPTTLGTDADCTLRLSDVGGLVGGRHARIWLREARFMLHHLDSRRITRVNDRPVTWVVLEPGDEIVIGPHRLRFEE